MTKHVHVDLMLQYAHDAQETDELWERWEYFHRGIGEWKSLKKLNWNPNVMYRHKSKMLSVTLSNGEIVSWPEPLNKLPEYDTQLWYLQGGSNYSCCNSHDNNYLLTDALKSGTLHLTQENAIRHINALYKINNQHKDN